MLIIHYPEGKSKETFYERVKVMQGAIKLIDSGEALCPICGGLLKLHGSYPRCIIDKRENAHHGWIAQGYCAASNKYHSLIPSFILPYRHYEAEVIEEALTCNEASGDLTLLESPVNNSTLYRWLRQFKERGTLAVGWLLSILYDIYDIAISIVKLAAESLINQLDYLSLRLLGEVGVYTLGRVNIVLSRHNRGFV
jgi:hypothetical protein